ncbi:MAG TPA: polyprenyl synthetase family protein, partial [Myxococcota bacterium]|nr:polyprenyl synthetase family protein [Myxococcota bacterium]
MSDASNVPALVSVSREDSVSRRSREARREPVLDPLANVARANGVDALAERLEELKALLADDLMQIELAIQGIDAEVREPMADRRVPTADGLLARRAARQLLDRPGKRIRPLCVLLAARMGGRSLDGVVRNLAVACEIVHAATLLHDDVLDQGDERRGAATARLIYGNSASILGGDHLLVEALKLVDGANEPTLLRSLLQVISEMVHAEAIQL